MVALVGLVALYNVKTQSDDENAVSSEAVEETADRSNLVTTEAVKETLGGTAKAEDKTESNNREKFRSRNRSKCCQGGRTDRTEL